MKGLDSDSWTEDKTSDKSNRKTNKFGRIIFSEV